MAPVQGYNALLGIGDTSTVDQPLDFLSESLACVEEFKDRAGLRGTRAHNIEATRAGIRRVGGNLRLQPTAVEWASLLPWILGGTPSGTNYPLAETLPAKYVAVNRSDGTDGKVFVYSGVKVNRATIRGTQGEPLELDLDLVGVDETVGLANSFPALTLDTTTAPFMFHDLVLSIAATEYQAKDVEIVIDHRLDGERFFNSQTRTAIAAQDRMIGVNTQLPYGDAEAAYNTGIAGVAVVATFTNGTVSLAFTMSKVQFPRRSPTAPGRTEIMLPLQGIAYKSGSTLELTTVLDSTVGS
jgi:hypothetical protein